MGKYQFSKKNLLNLFQKNKLFIFLLFALFVKQAVWMGLVPIWHFPDEQAHFAQVVNTAHFGPFGGFNGNRAASSDQIAMLELILDTKRNELGQNKYTFHPEYNITYTDSTKGLWEDVINQLPKDFTHEMGLNEATVYPFLYYWLDAFFYKLAASNSIITAIFASRILGILIYLLTAIVVWKLASKLFNNPFYQLILWILVMFQPMFSFVAAGISSDILFNFIFTLFLYFGILLMEKVTPKRLLAILIILILGSLTKQQMLIAYIIAFSILIFKLKTALRLFKKYPQNSLLIGILLGAALVLAVYLGEFYRISGFITGGQYQGELNNLSIWQHIKWSLSHTYREVLPWYWGIFKWLGLTLPRLVHRTMMSIIALAALGNLFYLVTIIKSFVKDKCVSQKDQQILFLYLASLIYFVSLLMWDYFFRRSYGFSFGLQGRYYFPVIITHMVFIIVGWKSLFGFIENFLKLKISLTNIAIGILGLWWPILHLIALWVVAKSYYDINDLNIFIMQISQYKPLIFKGLWWVFWITSLSITQFMVLITIFIKLIYAQKDKTIR